MTKTIGISAINFYQAFLSPILKVVVGADRFCRFPETCSAYTKRSIIEKGLLKGTYFGFIRLLKCQPFYN